MPMTPATIGRPCSPEDCIPLKCEVNHINCNCQPSQQSKKWLDMGLLGLGYTIFIGSSWS